MKSGSTLDARTRRAEREGFEPSIRVSTYAGLANRCLQPLGHLSRRVSEVIGGCILRQPCTGASVAPVWKLSANQLGSAKGSRFGSVGARSRGTPYAAYPLAVCVAHVHKF